jgi:predicted nucleotidyltransferase
MVYSTTELESIVTEYISEALKRVNDIDEIWLFGSYAEGKAHDDSDIDLAVISSHFGDNALETVKKLHRALWDMNRAVDIEIHGFTNEDFLNGWIGKEIRGKGRRVYKKPGNL